MFSNPLCNIFSACKGKKNALNIAIVSDGTDTIVQSRELAKNITTEKNIFEFNRLEANSKKIEYDLAIGVGYNVTDTLLGIKERSKGKTKIAIILDPLKNHTDFDFIILPSYEPYSINTNNIIKTTALINYINQNYLKNYARKNRKKFAFIEKLNLPKPYISVIIGGKHTGGNITEEDIKIMMDRVNEIVSKKGGSALISTSRRTEKICSEAIRKNIKVPYFLYDYSVRDSENPYSYFLAISEEIIVTGESVRMMSEACSSGKNVRIYKPILYGFQYKSLIEELFQNNYAVDLLDKNFDSREFKTSTLNEAQRIGEIIKCTKKPT